MNIAVMGATSHIAKNLTVRFAAETDDHLTLFCRDRRPVEFFVEKYASGGDIRIVSGYEKFNEFSFDVIINCIGAGAPGKAGFDVRNWFTLTAGFDDLALGYQDKVNPAALLITFSSGAVYGTRTVPPFSAQSTLSVPVNNIAVSDYYSIARLHSEARHRSLADRRIADLRIFSFFSCFIDPDSGYFMSDVLKAVANKEVLITGQADMIRDYIAPDDLFRLIKFCMDQDRINGAFDVMSAEAAGKFDILHSFQEKFGLQWRFDRVMDSPNGNKPVYVSNFDGLEKAGFKAQFSSLEGLTAEMERFLVNVKEF